MNSYPRDEFDDIDENKARRGAYRGATVDRATSRAGLLAIIISGLLALIVGGTMYVISPRTAAPEAADSSSATATASVSPSATEAAPTTNPASVTVEVYNSSAPAGAAAQATAVLEGAGYTVTSTANWTGVYSTESMVYFATGASSEANEVADTLGLPTIVQDYEADTGLIYVVLGADFDPSALPEAASSPSAAAQESTDGEADTGDLPSDSATAIYSERYSYDPATATFYLDPAGSYIYDPVSGTYQLG